MWEYLSTFDFSLVVQQLLANTVLVGVAGWIAKVWAEKNLERVRGEQAKQLEKARAEISNLSAQLQSGIEKRMRVFETHFNLEFNSYQDLWKACDETMMIASQTLAYIQMTPTSPKEWEDEKADSIKRYDKCRNIYTDIRRRRPFIAQEISDSSEELALGCLRIVDKYRLALSADKKATERGDHFDRKDYIKEIKEELSVMEKAYKHTATLISKRIGKLYVADFSLGV